jgi:hypothetical protein
MKTNFNLFTSKVRAWDTSSVHGWLHIYVSPEFLEIRLRNLWVIKKTPTKVLNLSSDVGKQLPWTKYKGVVEYYDEN